MLKRRMKLFCFMTRIALIVFGLLLDNTEGFAFDNQNQNFLWDVNRCSNINPIVDSKTIILIAKGAPRETDQFCSAIRRDLKVSDEVPYEMSTEFNNISGSSYCTSPCGHLGFMFNVWDDNNYDFVYKR